MKKKVCAAVLSLALALSGGQVFADSSQPKQKHSDPCKEDVQKFCSDVTPGEGRVIKCLKEHEQELSQSCQEALKHGLKPRTKPTKN
ncbi:MAG TPA: cysteine rich repeat-containing protein [Geobacteraceae bacterium]|nr:cysteine rich repeat-containing protein [Geobacteraceae bacterium]